MTENILLAVFIALPLLLAWGLRRFFRSRRVAGKTRAGPLVLAAGNALVMLQVLSVLILAGECYYRFFHDTTDSFGLTRTTRRWLSRHFRLNERGFRDNVDYRNRIAAGKRRVTFVGDSFTAGHGVRNVRHRFANIIRRRRPDWEIHVGARLGFDTPDQLNLLESAARSPYEFDWVVLVYNLNDIASVMPGWKQVYNRIYYREEPFLVRHSWLFNILYYRARGSLDPDVRTFFRFTRDGYETEAWQVQQRLLRRIRDVVESRGGRFAVVTFPFLRAVDPRSPLRRIHRKLDQFWSRLGVPHLDLLEALSGIPRWRLAVNRHDAHPNAYAQALAASAIEPFLEGLLASLPPGGQGRSEAP